MNNKGLHLAAFLVALISVGGSLAVIGVLQTTKTVSSSGIIVQPALPLPPPPEPTVNVGVYSDSGCNSVCSVIEWGSIAVGSTITRNIWIKNLGDSALTLSMDTDNWSSTGAQNHIDLSWDDSGNVLASGSVRRILLTLSVDPSISGVDAFYFDIIIVGHPQ